MPKIVSRRKVQLKKDNNSGQFVRECVLEAREYLLNELEEARALSNPGFQRICMFAIIDSLAQEHAGYTVEGSKKIFCDFVNGFQDEYDYLKRVEPITLYYDYENKINEVIENQELYDFDPTVFLPMKEVNLDDIDDLNGKKVEEVIKTEKADEILELIEKQESIEVRRKYEINHSFIALLYKMRSKVVHELSTLGSEGRWEDNSEPYYQMTLYPDLEGNIETFYEIYELIIPNKFIYNLAKSCIINYLDYCYDTVHLPFGKNNMIYRRVYATWNDKELK